MATKALKDKILAKIISFISVKKSETITAGIEKITDIIRWL